MRRYLELAVEVEQRSVFDFYDWLCRTLGICS